MRKVKEVVKLVTFKKNNKGIHAKTKSSKNKNSKLYKKVYRGQGR